MLKNCVPILLMMLNHHFPIKPFNKCWYEMDNQTRTFIKFTSWGLKGQNTYAIYSLLQILCTIKWLIFIWRLYLVVYLLALVNGIFTSLILTFVYSSTGWSFLFISIRPESELTCYELEISTTTVYKYNRKVFSLERYVWFIAME